MSCIYIILIRRLDLLKIGKSDNLASRIIKLEKEWGEIDKEGSYFLQVPSEDVFDIEAGIHKLLKNHSATIGFGDGYSEMFNLECLESAVSILTSFAKSSNYQLNKGLTNLPDTTKESKKVKLGMSKSNERKDCAKKWLEKHEDILHDFLMAFYMEYDTDILTDLIYFEAVDSDELHNWIMFGKSNKSKHFGTIPRMVRDFYIDNKDRFPLSISDYY